MGKCKLIGITGGIGAGKSTVTTYIDMYYGRSMALITDIIAYEVMRKDMQCMKEIDAVFKGYDIYNNSHEIDSHKIGRIIFHDEEKKRQMNAAVHPRVIHIVKEQHKEAALCGMDFVLAESALLIECGLADDCDEVIYVSASKETRIKRLMKYRGYPRKKCESIIAGQLSDEAFLAAATAVVDSSGTRKETYQNADRVMAGWGYVKDVKSLEGGSRNDILSAVAGFIDD